MELRRFADDDLKRKLETVDGVAAVKVGGGLEDEVQVDIDQRKLAQLGLSLDTVVQRLQQENINVSGGRLEEGTQRYLVRTVNQFANVEEIGNMLLTTRAAASGGGASDQAMRVAAASGDASVMAALSQQGSSGNATAGGMALRLKDVAEVRQGYKEREAIIRLDGREAVELAIYKEGDANTVSTAAMEVKSNHREHLPADIELPASRTVDLIPTRSRRETRRGGGGLLAIRIIPLRDGWRVLIRLSLPVSSSQRYSSWTQWAFLTGVAGLLALATGMVGTTHRGAGIHRQGAERGHGMIESAIVGPRIEHGRGASTLTPSRFAAGFVQGWPPCSREQA